MKRTLSRAAVLPLFFSVLIFTACYTEPVSESSEVFRTACRITIHEGGPQFPGSREKLIRSCFDELLKLDLAVDTVDPESEMNRLVSEASASGRLPEFRGHQAEICRRSFEMAEFFDGAFDPTIAPLVRLWNIGTGGETVPAEEEIRSALDKVGWEKWLEGVPPGGMLDFGASAKGYAAGIVRTRLEEAGVRSAVINIGGNVTVLGNHPDNRPWRIGVQDPYDERGISLLLLELTDLSASTSGIYERYFMVDDVRYHHILDPKTGYPARGELASVTVVSGDSHLTDIASTALFVTDGKAAEKTAIEMKNLEALFVYRNGELSVTPGLADRIFFPEGKEVLPYRIISDDQD